jgi:hypothetical protein
VTGGRGEGERKVREGQEEGRRQRGREMGNESRENKRRR